MEVPAFWSLGRLKSPSLKPRFVVMGRPCLSTKLRALTSVGPIQRSVHVEIGYAEHLGKEQGTSFETRQSGLYLWLPARLAPSC